MRVSRINKALQLRGVITWFDEDRMEGSIVDAMIAGIDASGVVAVCITERYMKKVGSGVAKDNCRKEFNYAKSTIGVDRMIAIPMEPGARNPEEWIGPVQMEFGTRLCESHFADDASFEEQIESLATNIRRLNATGRKDKAFKRGARRHNFARTVDDDIEQDL